MRATMNHPIALRFAAVALAAALAGCSDPRGDPWEKVKELEARVTELEQQLDDCQRGPGRQLMAAQAALDKGELELALQAARTLVAQHPGTAEAQQAAQLIGTAEARLAETTARQAAASARDASAAAEVRARALRQLVARADKAQGVTYYHHKSAPAYLNARSVLAPYIVVGRDGSPYLVLRNVYVAKELLTITAVTITADGRRFEFPETFERDSDDVSVWEWSEGAAGAAQRDMLAAVAAAKSATIRYHGTAGNADRAISAAEKTMIRDVLGAYDALYATP